MIIDKKGFELKTINNRLTFRKFDISILFLMGFLVLLFRGNASETYYVFIMLILWVISSLITNPKAFVKMLSLKTTISLGVFLVYAMVISIVSVGLKSTIGYLLGQLTLFSGIMIYGYYRSKYNDHRLFNLGKAVLVVWLYYCVKAILFYQENEFAAREIISHNDEYANVGIGKGYGLALGSAMLGVYLINYLMSGENKKKHKAVVFLCIVVTFIVVYKTASSIITLAMLTGIALSVVKAIENSVLKGSNNRSKKLLKISLNSLISIIGITLVANSYRIGVFLIDISDNFNKWYQSRLTLIAYVLMGEGSTGTLAARERLYKMSIETFLDNPLFGTVHINGLMKNYLMGGHSELFDKMALLGIIGGGLFLLVFILNIARIDMKKLNFMSSSYIITFSILFIFNQFNYSQANIILFAVLPLLADRIKKSKAIEV